MENKKRLIDAKDFDLRVSQKKMSEVFPNWKEMPKEVQDAVCKHAQYFHMLLETQATVDAVEVVRCKGCEYAVGHDEIHKTVLCQKRSAYPRQWDEMPFDGFCSYGERKEG